MLRPIVAVLLAAPLIAGPAFARDQQWTLATPGNRSVLIWKNGRAMDEGMTLMESGVVQTNPRLVARLLSCIVPNGTKAIISDHGFATHTILVTSGEHAGCRGDVPREFVKP